MVYGIGCNLVNYMVKNIPGESWLIHGHMAKVDKNHEQHKGLDKYLQMFHATSIIHDT